MRKMIVGLVVSAFVGILAVDTGCAAAFCNPGVECGGACLAEGSDCCDPSAGTYCGPGLTCGPDNTCLTAGENQAVGSAEGCVNEGLLPCLDTATGVIGCIPLTGVCCFNGRYCQDNQTCGGACGDECCDI
jgi:hypothetical protein